MPAGNTHCLLYTSSVKAKTIQEYVSEWNRFFKDTELVKMKIGEIKPITLIRFFREATKDRQFTHKRVSNARSVLNGIMSYAIEEEIISHNPCLLYTSNEVSAHSDPYVVFRFFSAFQQSMRSIYPALV